ncbi:MAG: amidase [Alphaproteobacteria bacterium]|nr:amidase [Alphaproteobacteria bacterium]
MPMNEYADYDAMGLADLVRRREVTPSELLEEAISRAERHNPALNAIVYKAYDEARATAKTKLPEGPFAGVPFLIKDINCPVKGWPMSNGTKWMADYVSPEDDLIVTRYRQAGLVLFGKTNTPEFGITGTTEGGHLGPCRSPWNTDYITGGSSGGAAASVAAGILPMAHASDGLGSIRIPAACCGLVGMKPTRFRNPLRVPGPAASNVCQHVVTRTVRDSAALLDWTGRHDPHSPFPSPAKARPYLEEVSTKPARLRIGVDRTPPSGTPLHPDVAATLERTVDTLRALGHDVREAPLQIDWRTYYREQGLQGAANFAAEIMRQAEVLGRPPAHDDFEPLTRAAWEAGQRITAERAFHGLHTLEIMSHQIIAHWDTIDVLLSPTMITPPPPVGHIDPVRLDPKEVNKRQAKIFGFTPPFNFTGQPSMSLPLGQSSDGLPIGMMVTGRLGDEATLFQLAGQLETAMPWRDRRPKLWN